MVNSWRGWVLSVHEKIGIVVAGHGSKIPEAILQFQAQIALICSDNVRGRKKIRNEIVEYGFLEFQRPGIGEAIDRAIFRGANTIVVAPAMLTAAHHVKTDIPNIIWNAQQRYPLIPIHYARHLDLHPKILKLCKHRIRQAGLGIDLNETSLIVVGRGSSDSTGNEDVIKLTLLLRETFHFADSRRCYTSVAAPLLKDALAQADQQAYRSGRQLRSTLIFPYLLFHGVLLEKMQEVTRAFQEDHPDHFVKLALPLGPDPLVADALRDRCNATILLANQEKTYNHEKNGKKTA